MVIWNLKKTWHYQATIHYINFIRPISNIFFSLYHSFFHYGSFDILHPNIISYGRKYSTPKHRFSFVNFYSLNQKQFSKLMHSSDEIMNCALFYFLWVWLHGSSHKNNTNENVIHMRNENINKNLFPCYSMICKNFRENIFLEWRFQIRNSCTKTEAMKQCMFLRISKKWL